MSYWHEQVRPIGSWVTPSRVVGARRTGLVSRRSTDDCELFEAHFMRWEGEGEVPDHLPMWQRQPAGWFEFWPRERLRGPDREGLRAPSLERIPELDAGLTDEQYEKRPYAPPAKPEILERIEHPSGLARAM